MAALDKKRELPERWTPAGFWDLATVNCWTGPAAYFVKRLPESLGGDIPIETWG